MAEIKEYQLYIFIRQMVSYFININLITIDGHSNQVKGEYDKFAEENLGIFKIGAVDCDSQAKICEKEKITSFPTVRIYPQFPAPTIDMPGENF